jgi:putative (di)nucleoside polyphosphate hydrolase
MKHIKQKPLPYRPCVGIMLLNQENKVFIAQRLDTVVEAWQMPQGGIDEGETPEEAVMRELYEEVGTSNAEIIASTPEWHHYDLPKNLAHKLWDGRYRGQRQKWFALRFLGTDADINIDTPHPEFCAWRWAEVDELEQLAVPFKREVYKQVIQQLYPTIIAQAADFNKG